MADSSSLSTQLADKNAPLDSEKVLRDSRDPALAVLAAFNANPEAFVGRVALLKDGAQILVNAAKNSDNVLLAAQNVLLALRHMLPQHYVVPVYHDVAVALDTINPDHLEVLLDHIEENPLLVMLIVIHGLKVDKQCELVIHDYLRDLIDDRTNFLQWITVMELLFPVVPSLVVLYTSTTTKNAVLEQITKITASNGLSSPEGHRTVVQLLRLVCASSIDEQCRAFSAANYLELLVEGSRTNDTETRGLLTLALVKLWTLVKLKESDITPATLYTALVEALPQYSGISVEGLAYLTLNGSVRNTLRGDVDTVNRLTSLLSTDHGFGVVMVLSNITRVTQTKSADHRTVEFLKNYSNNNKEDADEAVPLFNRQLVHDDVMSKLTKVKTSNPSTVNQLMSIIHNLTFNQDKPTRQALVKQGTLNIVLDYLIKHSVVTQGQTRPNPQADIDTRVCCLRSLARLAVAVHPKAAFNKYDVLTCVPFLVELLGPDISEYLGQLKPSELYLDDMTNLDKYEGLAALTNVASVTDSDLLKLIISRCFESHVDNLILLDVKPVQRAAWELVCNLIGEPSLMVKFFNVEGPETSANWRRLQLLIKLLDSPDTQLQLVLAGLLANATEYDMICQVLASPKVRGLFVTTLEEVMVDVSDELELRLCYVLYNIVSVTPLPECKKLVAPLIKNKSPQVVEVAVEILRSI